MNSTRRGISLVGSISLLGCLVLGCPDNAPYRPNILLIVVDTLRADHLPFYGYDIDTAPFLAEWAARSVVFEHAWSTSSWTAPATASILTGVYPAQHGVNLGLIGTKFFARSGATIQVDGIPDGLETLAELLRDNGYSTFGVADNPNITHEQGYADGFEHFSNSSYSGASHVNATVESWQSKIVQAEPWFVYLHYMDPHLPYHGREPRFRTRLRKDPYRVYAYDSEIALVDDHVRDVFQTLSVDDDTLVVFTSDHGEEFLDHGSLNHNFKLYSELTHVPFFIRHPGVRAQRVNGNVSIVDLLPTLRSTLALPTSAQDAGFDLTQHFGDLEPTPKRPVFASRTTGLEWKYSVVRGSHKLIWSRPGKSELYDLAADPGEKQNLADERPALVKELAGESGEFFRNAKRWESKRTRLEASPDQLRQLEQLGYVEPD